MKLLIKAGLAISAFFAASLASTPAIYAQGCTETQFGTKTGERYLKAENAMTGEDNPAKAVQLATELRTAVALNCYEQGIVARLLAAAYIKMGQTTNAVRELESSIRLGVIPAKDVPQTYYNIAQLYLQDENLNKAKEYMQKWLASGQRPTDKQNLQLAQLWHMSGDDRGAIKYAEAALNQVGNRNAERSHLDFLNYLYNKTGQYGKQARFLQEVMLPRWPDDRNLWEGTCGLYQQADDDEKTFECIKLMYLMGFYKKEDEIMRIVNFYNSLDAPYAAARILEKEMNAGRITKNKANLERLAELYQVSREYAKSVPVFEQANRQTNDAKYLYRAGRSLFELGKYKDADAMLSRAVAGNFKGKADAYALIGQSRYELGDRQAARKAFLQGSKFGGNGGKSCKSWVGFIDHEIYVEKQLAEQTLVIALEEKSRLAEDCKALAVVDATVNCDAQNTELAEAQAAYDAYKNKTATAAREEDSASEAG